MKTRRATAADLPVVERLWLAFVEEVPEPPHLVVDEAEELREVAAVVDAGLAFLAEADGAAVGLALVTRKGPTLAMLTDLYVAPDARRGGVAAALVREIVEHLGPDGVVDLELEVLTDNADARAVYQRWGFAEHTVALDAPVDALRQRLEPGSHAVSFASIHVQTDDAGTVERAAAAFAPRIGSGGTRIEGPSENGWTTIYDEVIDRDPTALVRFAREVSSRLGAVVIALSLELDHVVRFVALDRGGIVDEYLSVPEFYGPLPPGDVIGLAANPTVLHRLTGADPNAVKDIARTASTTADPARPGCRSRCRRWPRGRVPRTTGPSR
jgi:ribosomal protein S18 acetylase RimI-like enzyme